ncbi:hypothetical protein WMY93_017765 [Mugilogobius chulae]|uniref:Uncharacterized protein n=1 Tax=Mugilogobius chulae TaxID=88201 RepID=A0AAW0NQB5_9GOBI
MTPRWVFIVTAVEEPKTQHTQMLYDVKLHNTDICSADNPDRGFYPRRSSSSLGLKIKDIFYNPKHLRLSAPPSVKLHKSRRCILAKRTAVSVQKRLGLERRQMLEPQTRSRAYVRQNDFKTIHTLPQLQQTRPESNMGPARTRTYAHTCCLHLLGCGDTLSGLKSTSASDPTVSISELLLSAPALSPLRLNIESAVTSRDTPTSAQDTPTPAAAQHFQTTGFELCHPQISVSFLSLCLCPVSAADRLCTSHRQCPEVKQVPPIETNQPPAPPSCFLPLNSIKNTATRTSELH